MIHIHRNPIDQAGGFFVDPYRDIGIPLNPFAAATVWT